MFKDLVKCVKSFEIRNTKKTSDTYEYEFKLRFDASNRAGTRLWMFLKNVRDKLIQEAKRET